MSKRQGKVGKIGETTGSEGICDFLGKCQDLRRWRSEDRITVLRGDRSMTGREVKDVAMVQQSQGVTPPCRVLYFQIGLGWSTDDLLDGS